MRMHKNCRVWLWVAAATLVAGPAALAGNIKVAWDPVPGANGYRLYYGPSAGNYTDTVDVGNVTEATLWNLTDCVDYYIAAKAYNNTGESAQFSGDVEGWPRPNVYAYPTIAADQGAQFTVDIGGTNFQPGSQLVLDDSNLPRDAAGNPLVRVESYSIVGCNLAQAQITVEPLSMGFRAMEIGSFSIDFELINPGGIYAARGGTLDIDFNERRSDINRVDAGTRDRVDGKDLVWLAYAYGQAEGAPRYNPDADLDGDGQVDGEDLALLAAGFGRCWNGATWTVNACP